MGWLVLLTAGFFSFLNLNDGAQELRLAHVLNLLLPEVQLARCQGDADSLATHELEGLKLFGHTLVETCGAGVAVLAAEDPSENLSLAGVDGAPTIHTGEVGHGYVMKY